ncbi:MAG TPA: DUF494 family protein [Gemmatimonadaceae bacterium]|nr:DUF494 family protein [Gemmatimonadaceae bacterium]
MTDRWQAVLSALRARFSPDSDAEEIADFLSSEGFDRRQIGEIVARFRADASAGRPGRGAAAQAALANHLPPIRVPGPHEHGRFAPEAWGQLVALHAGGVLTVLELERVIEHALDHVAGRIGPAELRAILEGIGLASAGASDDPVTIH